MTKQAPREVSAKRSDQAFTLLLTGVACLALGIGVGYYFGRQSSRVEETAGPQAQGTVQDPAAFMQNEASLKAMIASNSKDLNALIQLGNLYYDNNRFKDAVEWYGRALEVDPQNVGVRTDRGTSYWNLGMADSAVAEFQKSLELTPTHPQTLYNLGVVYLHGKNNPAEARKVWEKLLATNPDYPDRAKLQQELASISGSAGPAPAAAPKGASSQSMEDLLQRLKQRP